MPELRCPECGNELLPPKPEAVGDACICSKCGMEVYVWTKTREKTECPKCGKNNETMVAR
jgi:DNA-directed RNA polymerase subunit RPC12/RpoP